jgi:hypothetical protein
MTKNQTDLDATMARWLTPCDLDPELAACVYEYDDGWVVLKHKFVNEPFYNEAFHARYNEVLAHKRAEAAAALAAEDWSTFMWIHERPWRLDALLEIADRLDDKTYWDLVGTVWADSENIWQNLYEWGELLSDRRPGHEAMMDDDELMALHALPDTLTIYRGHRAWNQDGWSWTLDSAKAEWFAKRLAQEGDECYVTVAEVDKVDVVAYLAGRGEDEIVVDPEWVRHLSQIVVVSGA